MPDDVTAARLLGEVSDLAEHASAGAATGLLLGLTANILELLVSAQVDATAANIWIAQADLRAPESAQRELQFSVNQGSLSPVLADVRRLRRIVESLVEEAAAVGDQLVAHFMANRHGADSADATFEAKSRQALDTAETLGNVSVRMLGTCTHLVVVLPEERRHLLLLAGTCAAQAARGEARMVERRLRQLSIEPPADRMANLDRVASLCEERLARLEDTLSSL
jgi:hypothetical protein